MKRVWVVNLSTTSTKMLLGVAYPNNELAPITLKSGAPNRARSNENRRNRFCFWDCRSLV